MLNAWRKRTLSKPLVHAGCLLVMICVTVAFTVFRDLELPSLVSWPIKLPERCVLLFEDYSPLSNETPASENQNKRVPLWKNAHLSCM